MSPPPPNPANSPYTSLLPTVLAFPSHLSKHLSSHTHPYSLDSLRTYYETAGALNVALLMCTWNVLWTWIAGEVTGNVSQVDRMWTFLPPLYTAHFALYPFLSALLGNPHASITVLARQTVDPRMALLLALQLVWSARLSYNTFRRGLFSLFDEDYRWEIVRRKIPKWQFKIFNLLFIALAQNVLLLASALPAYYLHSALTQPSSAHALRPLSVEDGVLAALSLLNIVLEFVADGQQYAYQTWKRSVRAHSLSPRAEANRKRGFGVRGLWGWSRHPNFFFEQLNWWLWALFPFLASSTVAAVASAAAKEHTWAAALADLRGLPLYVFLSPLLMSGLFFASTTFTESISASKYPAYTAYQKRVSMFVPFLTPLKGVWLALRGAGEKERVEREVWGVGEKGGKRS